MDAIKTMGLTKQYKNCLAVDRLDLTVAQGELFALLGVNGAGKTTTVKMLSCLTAPTDGDALVGGHSILTNQMDVKSLIGVSPQETAVASNLTVKENLELMCRFQGMEKQQQAKRLRQISEQFGLDSILNRKSGKLSGGWQRRVSIAMALIGSPSVLFLDEPTLGLDVLARRELWALIRSLKGQVTVVMTTHYMEEAEALCDRVGIMKDGRLLALGTVSELMAQTGAQRFEDAFIALVKEV